MRGKRISASEGLPSKVRSTFKEQDVEPGRRPGRDAVRPDVERAWHLAALRTARRPALSQTEPFARVRPRTPKAAQASRAQGLA
jgi:hypothetical protein